MGLIGTVARTAVISGTATSVSNRVSRRQYNRWADQEVRYEQPAPPPAAPAPPPSVPTPSAGAEDRIAQLKELANLKAQGILTDAELAAEKARILGA